MKQSQYRFVGLASLLLMVSASFVACGGLDARKVTRGADYSSGGDEPTAGTEANTGGSESAGGGEPNVNPFGGAFDSGGAPVVVDGPPEVVQVDPAEGDDSVEPDATVSLLFNEAIDPGTVSSASVKLFDGDSEVEGEVTLNQGLIGTFEPVRSLSLLASYDVSVSTLVTDLGGTALKQSFASTFTVRDGQWSTQKSLLADTETWGYSQDLQADGRGNVLAVWTILDAETQKRALVGRWYRPSSGWQPEVILEDSTDDVWYPRVAVSSDGDAIVAWFTQDGNQNFKVRARRFVSGAWEPAAQDVAPMSTGVFNSSPASLAPAIGGGQSVVAWIRMEYVPDPFAFYYTLSLAATSLEGAWPDYPTENFTAVYSGTSQDSVANLSAIVDAKGNALVTYHYDSLSTDPSYGGGIYYTRKPAAGSWQYPAKIAGTLKVYGGPYLATDGDGSMAVWLTFDDTQKYALVASRYTKAKQFAAAVAISDPDLAESIGLGQRSIAANSQGFIATWAQQVKTSLNAYVNRYDIATASWDRLPTPISDGVAPVGYQPSVGLDHHGNAIVTFEQEVAQYQTGIMAARYNANTGNWTTPETPISLGDNSYSAPLLAVGGNGIAAVLFQGGRDRGEQFPTVGGQYAIFK